ncbi:GspH/FimT family pseudopilin [Microbulbifer taiwanensis]|uniref:Type II secretion system protein H n=1 Tax=Microbulbifer taiwanensis TaxID=986746 RepID=A0ABW1YPG4_9GAMM|nr:GspH/FimT family pseudopilin [Microbulbifer taiwanensis]
MNNFRRMAGFTLVELMVVLMVLGIITAMGVPSFNTMIKNNRMVTMTNDLNGTLQYARAEAVRRGGAVQVSAIDGDVNNGLRVWVNENADKAYNSGTDTELRVLRIDLAQIELDADVGTTPMENLDFTFNARGESSLGDILSLGLCDDRDGLYGRQLQMLVSGAVRLQKDTACTK